MFSYLSVNAIDCDSGSSAKPAAALTISAYRDFLFRRGEGSIFIEQAQGCAPHEPSSEIVEVSLDGIYDWYKDRPDQIIARRDRRRQERAWKKRLCQLLAAPPDSRPYEGWLAEMQLALFTSTRAQIVGRHGRIRRNIDHQSSYVYSDPTEES